MLVGHDDPRRIVAEVGIRHPFANETLARRSGEFVWPESGNAHSSSGHRFLYAWFTSRAHLRLRGAFKGCRQDLPTWRVVSPTSAVQLDPATIVFGSVLRDRQWVGPVPHKIAGRFASANVLLTGTFAECAAFMLAREWDDPRIVSGR